MDLSAILELVATAPMGKGLSRLVDHFLEGSATLLPSLAIGACVVDEQGGTPIVASRLPPGSVVPPGRDPSRLFPSFGDEAIFELADGARGSTFHVATEAAVLDARQISIADSIAHALGAMLGHARTVERSLAQTRGMARSQAKLIQTDKLASLGQIVAGVVHELNNPLTSIIAYSDYLKKGAQQRAAQGIDVSDELERLRRIGEAAERILKFSRDLVAYARPTPDIPGPVVLSEVVDKAIVFCEHEFSRNSIVVHKRLAPDLPPIRGIAGQLTQVFVNLFTNATHAMHQTGGILEIDARSVDSEFLLVEVADSGVGITDDDLEQIFEPFYTTKVDGGGTGLGLSIVRDIVTQHGGELSVTRRPIRGTAFILRLPLVALPTSSRPPARGAS